MKKNPQISLPVSENIPNAVTLAAMEDAENGNHLHGTFDSIADLMEALKEEKSSAHKKESEKET